MPESRLLSPLLQTPREDIPLTFACNSIRCTIFSESQTRFHIFSINIMGNVPQCMLNTPYSCIKKMTFENLVSDFKKTSRLQST